MVPVNIVWILMNVLNRQIFVNKNVSIHLVHINVNVIVVTERSVHIVAKILMNVMKVITLMILHLAVSVMMIMMAIQNYVKVVVKIQLVHIVVHVQMVII
ncbi:hypothetical protein BLA29_012846 [Euroglyphus maynei]|uniref:Uncharacterized protein n=1 Tax=Euroglyphus maynei TaxID=6958 RepID=A0A1Y3BSS1_EURMA|nr:hypothetical protein BLA29_012846 [Euroglyphus maynei]